MKILKNKNVDIFNFLTLKLFYDAIYFLETNKKKLSFYSYIQSFQKFLLLFKTICKKNYKFIVCKLV
jgi:hypothetical protein